MRALLFAALLLFPAMQAQAIGKPEDMLPDPAAEARAREIGRELRCMVCQNQSIEESEADMARDLRLLVREQVAHGASNQQVTEYIHARYGDFILLRPPFNTATLLLWGAPLLVLLGGGIVVALRSRTPRAATAPLTEAERRRLDDITGDRQA